MERKKLIYENPQYRLEVCGYPERYGRVTVDFLVTFPQALNPRTERAHQFNLPRDAMRRLGKFITELGGSE